MSNDPLAFIHDDLARLQSKSLTRTIRPLASPPSESVVQDGKALLHFASNNYLGLASDPRVIDAANAAADRWGVGSGSARLITGGSTVHEELEQDLARFKGTESALLFSSGYLANVGAITAITDSEDEIFSDQLNHASIVDGARLSKARVRVYRHADVDHLDALLRSSDARRKLVVTDTVFSMDGDLAPLQSIVELCERYGAILMTDEAHATGVVGPGGRGLIAELGLEGRVQIVMGTLSKSLGSAGGFLAGSAALISLLLNTARSFIFDTALPAPVVAAAKRALEILVEEPQHVERVRSNAVRLARGLRAGTDPCSAIIPIVIGSSEGALRVSEALREEGILVPAIRPPSVPQGTSRLRATVMSSHTHAHIDAFVDAFARVTVSSLRR
ncbi:MAG: 8-amino-7-oxononanoate synthase [Actinomycetota bacterium]